MTRRSQDRDIRFLKATIPLRRHHGDERALVLEHGDLGYFRDVAIAPSKPSAITFLPPPRNFVGGWLGEGCRTAGEINGTLFQRGGKFARPTLWLYGQQDSFYSIEHSRSNFDAFEKAGGIGEFFEFAVPGGSGHRLTGYPSLWTGAVEKYLIAISTPQSQ